MTRMMAAALAMALAGASTYVMQPKAPGQAPSQLAIKSMPGRDLYQFYCATCHGCDAKGTGPVAAALKTPPGDLTRLAADNGGTFPRERIVSLVSGRGRSVPAHGSSDMPVWGPIFRSLDVRAGYDEIRVANIVSYLESIQLKPPPSDCR
jgi:mono/diheme cytochrome c family protein